MITGKYPSLRLIRNRKAEWTRRLVEEILYSSRRLPPTVVDADALNILSLNNSANSPWWKMFDHEAILTPHPGEMGRL